MPTADPSKQRARTKIIATVGPASRDEQMLARLVQNGVDIFRLNMAHGQPAEHEQTIAAIRRISQEVGRPIGVLVDLAGPKIRLGQLEQDPTECREGDEFIFVRGEQSNGPHDLTCSYENLVDELKVGDSIMLADGIVGMLVTDKQPDAAHCRVVSAGTIRSRQGVNLPGVSLSIETLTDADREHAAWAATHDVDFVGLSFVRSPADIRELKEILHQYGSDALAVAKIEKREALDELNEIVAAADAVMVARGDLGVEVDVAMTPVVQKRIIAACQRMQRPVIVATQMLDSMHQSRRPTRAEASDVANAILDGTDACMLSGETAIGQYPVEAVATMNRIMLYTEQLLRDHPSRRTSPATDDVHPVTSAVVYGAAQIARQIDARLVVVVTHSGATARAKSKQRDFIPTIGVSDSPGTLRRMCLFWGITPLAGAPVNNLPQLRHFIDRWGLKDGSLAPGDGVVFVTGTGTIGGGHNLLVVYRVEAREDG